MSQLMLKSRNQHNLENSEYYITLISKAATPFTYQVKTLQADACDSKNFCMIG